MEWQDVLNKNPIHLNLGGGRNCHPSPGYEHYIVIDRKVRCRWVIQHDLTQPIPLPDQSVDRILTEDFIEHIALYQIEALLSDCHRLLKPGGLMRIGVPDYGNPKNRPALVAGNDLAYPGHITLTHYALLRDLVARSPFENYEFYQYWEDDRYIWKPIDYSLGLVCRTPENYYRLYMRSPRHIYHQMMSAWRDCRLHLDQSENPAGIRFGHPLYTTSLVVDLRKEDATGRSMPAQIDPRLAPR